MKFISSGSKMPRVVSEVRLAGQRPGAGGLDVGKVGADRLVVAVDRAVREGDPQHGGDRIGHDQDDCVAAQPRVCEPLPARDFPARWKPCQLAIA